MCVMLNYQSANIFFSQARPSERYTPCHRHCIHCKMCLCISLAKQDKGFCEYCISPHNEVGIRMGMCLCVCVYIARLHVQTSQQLITIANCYMHQNSTSWPNHTNFVAQTHLWHYKLHIIGSLSASSQTHHKSRDVHGKLSVGAVLDRARCNCGPQARIPNSMVLCCFPLKMCARNSRCALFSRLCISWRKRLYPLYERVVQRTAALRLELLAVANTRL